MADKPSPRTMTVLSSRRLTPAMHRVTLGGEGMADFQSGQQGGYVKLMLDPREGGSKPNVRTYTIRNARADALDLDFALHGEGEDSAGPATAWALGVSGGETVMVGGPGPAKPLPGGFDNYLLAGDMTALPAISVNLETMDRAGRGLAVIEVQDEADRQDIDAPAGVEIRWLVNPRPGTRPDLLADAVRAWEWPNGTTYAWVASEFSAMRQMRDYLRGARGLGPDSLYISSYWKSGSDEDRHRVAKRADLETAS